LFLIFINDIEQFFKDKGAIGVPISHEQDILTLLYADDLIIFGSSKTDLQQKLNILQDYCQQNKMMVNVEKSKVVIFRRGGRLAATDNFTYNGQNMEISNQFNYLGVMFSSHGVFHKAAEQALCKGRVAVANVRRTMTNSKMVSFDSRLKLFNAVVKATLLYGCETWGSRYEDEIEKCQSYFSNQSIVFKGIHHVMYLG
jgi:Reverse transcriptase (RNA-dependent DNA polymerase).